MHPNDENDSDDVRNFYTMGGLVPWAVNAYKYMDAVRAEGQTQPLLSEVPESFDAYRERECSDSMDDYIRFTPLLAEEGGGTSGEEIISDTDMDAILAATPEPQSLPTISRPTNPMSSSREMIHSAIPARTLLGTQATAAPQQAMLVASHAHGAEHTDVGALDPLPYKIAPDGAFSLSENTRQHLRRRAPPAQQTRTNASACSSSVKVEDLDDEATGALASQAGPSRTKGKSVARRAPYTPPTAPTPAAHPTTGGRHNPSNPPPGWVAHYTAGWTPKWTWDGDEIPESWNPHDVWEQLKAKYNLSGSKPCGWTGCGKGPTLELRKHVLGVHLKCKYKCRGCGYVYPNRFDNWTHRPPAEGVHGPECPTDTFWRGRITLAGLEEALAERARRARVEEESLAAAAEEAEDEDADSDVDEDE